MAHDDVSSYDMDNGDLTDLELDELLDGTISTAADSSPVAKFVDEARTALDNVSPGVPTAALREFLHVAPVEQPITVAVPTQEVVELVSVGSAKERNKARLVPALAAFALFGALVAGALAVPSFGERGEDLVVADATTNSAAASGTSSDATDTTNPASTSSTDVSNDTNVPSEDSSSSTGTTHPAGAQVTANLESGSTSPKTSSGSSGTADNTSSTSDGSSTSEGTSSTSSSTPAAGSSTSPTPTSTTHPASPSSSTTVPTTVANQSISYSVPGVISLTVSVVDGSVSMSNIALSPGWSIESQHSDGYEAEIRVTDGTFEVRVEAEIDDGLLRVRVRDDRDEGLEIEANFDDGSIIGEPIVKAVDDDDVDHPEDNDAQNGDDDSHSHRPDDDADDDSDDDADDDSADPDDDGSHDGDADTHEPDSDDNGSHDGTDSDSHELVDDGDDADADDDSDDPDSHDSDDSSDDDDV